jgi:hypothetical protein
MPAPAESVPAILNHALRASLPAEDLQWIDTVYAAAVTAPVSEVLRAYTAAARVGAAPLAVSGAQRAQLDAAVPGLDFSNWTQTDTARAVLLLDRAAALGAEACAAAATACYEQGDAAEQRSWLRAIALLPSPSQFTPLAIDACRTNIQPVFQAIACENPFPAAHFPERNFNQMVLKALFNNVALSRIVGLRDRLNSELARMAGDYAAERRAAGRSVPADIGQVL